MVCELNVRTRPVSFHISISGWSPLQMKAELNARYDKNWRMAATSRQAPANRFQRRGISEGEALDACVEGHRANRTTFFRQMSAKVGEHRDKVRFRQHPSSNSVQSSGKSAGKL